MLENELFEFLEGATNGAFSQCQQGVILSWNPAAERLFGSFSSEVPGKSRYFTDGVLLGRKRVMREAAFWSVPLGERGIPSFNLPVRPCSGERLFVDCPQWCGKTHGTIIFWRLIWHVTSLGRRERHELLKKLQMCRQFDKIAEEAVPAQAPCRRFPNKSRTF